MEIKVGDYVRLKNGIIGTLIEISKAGNGVRYAGEYIMDTIFSIYINPHKEVRVKDREIKSHSNNIIDLIEEGDYVNGHRVEEIIDGIGEKIITIDAGDLVKGLLDYEIKEMLTKEQFEANEYRI